jgi:serine/threonine protein kinase
MGYAEPSSDIYSLAKVGIEMMTGARLSDLLPNASLDLPERASELVRGLSLGLSEETVRALSSALQYDPAKRPRAASTFVFPLVRDLELADCGAEL